MKWRHWAILIVLVLLNYIIFSTAFTQLAEQRQPGPRGTRTPAPTFEGLAPTAQAWIVLPTHTPRPTETPIMPTPTVSVTASAEVTVTVETTATTTIEPATAAPEPTTTPAPSATRRPPTVTPSGETVVHTVQRGETLSGIAVQYGVTMQAIVDANGIEDPSYIVTGQKLIIPVSGQVTPRPTRTPGASPSNTPKSTQKPPAASNTPKPTQKPPAATNTPKPPTATPAPTAAGLQFTAEVIWDPLVAPNCSGPAIAKQSIIRNTGGGAVNGVRVEVDCYGNKWLSHPSGNPGEYEAGHYDFVFGQTTPQDWTCTARVYDWNGQPVDSSEVVTIHFDTNDCKPYGSGHQVAIVNWTKHW